MTLRNSTRSTLLSAVQGSALLACAGLAMAADEKITFQDHIRPIFESQCNNCHNPDKKKGGLDLTSYAAAMAGGSSGEMAVSGAAGDSRVFQSVTKAAEPFMPPQGDPLMPAQIELIKKWIDGGLLETPNGVAKKAKKAAFEMKVATVTTGKPEGPPPMPENLVLEPVVVTPRAQATAALTNSPWAPLVAISGQHQVLLYNTDNLELAGVLPYKEGFVEALSFSRNGQLVVAGGGRGGKFGKVVAWEVKTGKRVFEVGEERDTVLASDLSADLSTVVLGGPSRRVKLYNTADGSLIKEIKKHTDWVTAAQFSPDGVLVATGDRAGGLFVWEAKTGNEFFSLPGHTGAIAAVSWRDDANILASASEDGTIRLWEMNEGKEVKKWTAHGGGVQSMAFTHDGRIVSCGRDNNVKIFDQNGGQKVAQNQFADLPLAATFSHNGERFIVGDWSGKVSVWNAADGKTVGEMSAAPPSIDQRLAALKPELEKNQQTATAAKDTLGSMANNLAAAQQEVEASRKRVADFQARAQQLEQTVAKAKGAAEALLARLNAPVPAPGATPPPSMDNSTAVALAADYLNVTASGKSALGPMGSDVSGVAKKFATEAPAAVVAAHNTIKAKTAEMTEMQKKAEEAKKTFEAANAALATHERSMKHWEAAKVNAAIFSRKDQLATLQSKVEDLAADVAAREKIITDAPAQIAAAPEAEKAPLQKKLAGAKDGIDALKKEHADTIAKVAALQKEIEAETARFLSMLPR